MLCSNRRRRFLSAAVGTLFMVAAQQALAATPLVEIIAFAHPPVESALKPLRQWLAQQGPKVRVVEIDLDSAEGQRRLKALGVTGHVPVVVLVDGKYRHPRRDGGIVEFISFPAGPGTPPGVKSSWSAADVEAVITQRY